MTNDRDRHRPSPAQPQPPSLNAAVELWTFSKGGHRWSAQLHAQGSLGFEVQILRAGKLRISRRFPKRSQAVAWAREEWTALEQGLP
jgi:hypothetical protein